MPDSDKHSRRSSSLLISPSLSLSLEIQQNVAEGGEVWILQNLGHELVNFPGFEASDGALIAEACRLFFFCVCVCVICGKVRECKKKNSEPGSPVWKSLSDGDSAQRFALLCSRIAGRRRRWFFFPRRQSFPPLSWCSQGNRQVYHDGRAPFKVFGGPVRFKRRDVESLWSWMPTQTRQWILRSLLR